MKVKSIKGNSPEELKNAMQQAGVTEALEIYFINKLDSGVL
jgi:hypothetical protein